MPISSIIIFLSNPSAAGPSDPVTSTEAHRMNNSVTAIKSPAQHVQILCSNMQNQQATRASEQYLRATHWWRLTCTYGISDKRLRRSFGRIILLKRIQIQLLHTIYLLTLHRVGLMAEIHCTLHMTEMSLVALSISKRCHWQVYCASAVYITWLLSLLRSAC